MNKPSSLLSDHVRNYFMTKKAPVNKKSIAVCVLLLSLLPSVSYAIEKYQTQNGPIIVENFAEGLESPWGFDFLHDGRILVTEKPGNLRLVGRNGQKSDPILGTPQVDYIGQGGLLDVLLHPNFQINRFVFLTFTKKTPNKGMYTSVVRGKLSKDYRALRDIRIIFSQTPKVGGGRHFGSRIVVAPDGNLFVTLGDLGNRYLAQNLNGHVGKVVRITIDGGIPKDNPFVRHSSARPEIWSYGHRNIQGADIHPRTGKLWTIEHGPRGGDELNIPAAASNYGWPLVSHGVEYSGHPVGDGKKFMKGVVPPLRTWTPVIAPGGMVFYDENLFPAWKGNLLIGGLRAGAIVRLTLNGESVESEERLLQQIGNRIRDVDVGPDGAVYALDETDGRILRISPAK